jgi:hypothetical protein
MKLEKARTILDIQDLTVFNRLKLKRYADTFNCCLDWICINPPGTCAVDLRYSEGNTPEKVDVRFFTLDSKGQCPLVPSYSQIYKLSANHRSEDIYFSPGCVWFDEEGNWHLGIDWQATRPGGAPIVALEQIVELSTFGLELTDRFYIKERK